LSAGARVFGTLVNPGVETVNIVMTDTNTTFTARLATLTVTDANAESIVITGNNGLALTHVGTALTTLNASAMTGTGASGVTLTVGALTTDSVAQGGTGNDGLNFGNSLAIVTMTGGAGVDTLTGGTVADSITGGEGADVITGSAGNDAIILTETTAAIDKVVFSGAAATNTLTVAANGVDVITGFGSNDTLNLAALGDATANASTVFSNSAATIRTMAVTEVNVLTTDGTAASITTGGTATLAVADYTATTLTNVAAFLTEGYAAAGATTDAGAFVINDANTDLTYVYNFINSTAASSIIAGELALVGTIDNGGTDLIAANIVFV